MLKELLVGRTYPVVTQVTPMQPGQTISGKTTIFWSTDGDGNPLTYNVEYNPNVTNPNPVWELIGENLTATSYTYDFSGLPGGQHAVIRVTATDGVLSGSALSDSSRSRSRLRKWLLTTSQTRISS